MNLYAIEQTYGDNVASMARKLYAIEQTQLWGQHRVVGRLMFTHAGDADALPLRGEGVALVAGPAQLDARHGVPVGRRAVARAHARRGRPADLPLFSKTGAGAGRVAARADVVLPGV